MFHCADEVEHWKLIGKAPENAIAAVLSTRFDYCETGSAKGISQLPLLK
jgi:hypothetical protein